jgi:hypothetical protein
MFENIPSNIKIMTFISNLNLRINFFEGNNYGRKHIKNVFNNDRKMKVCFPERNYDLLELKKKFCLVEKETF